MNIKLLLVDDEEIFVNTLAERLEARGFDTTVAFDGDSAVAVVRENYIDVVVLDVLMPGKSGIETLKEIKLAQPLTEVIMLTGNATVETAIEGMKLGAYDYLMKPTETADLVEKITNARKRKAEQEERIRNAEVKGIIKRRGW